jgi:hypothetical protein
METGLAVVYPALSRGDTAAGPDGIRGSPTGEMDVARQGVGFPGGIGRAVVRQRFGWPGSWMTIKASLTLMLHALRMEWETLREISLWPGIKGELSDVAGKSMDASHRLSGDL